MGKITWLHISDLHFNTKNTYDEKIVLGELLKDITNCIQENDLQPDFIVVTGDISFSSKPEEYSLATNFFDDLLKTANIPKNCLYIIPGNHDIDRNVLTPLSLAASEALTDQSKTNESLGNERERSFILERFHNYRDFINNYFGDKGIHFDDDNYFYIENIELAGLKIGVLGLNSSWLSSSNADYGKLQLGEKQIRKALDESKDVDFRMALIHHPFEWFREFERGHVDAQLMDNCDFILHGHMHRQSILELKTPDSNAVIIPAGTSYKSRSYRNSYNFVQLDLEKQIGTIFFRTYSNDRGGFWTHDVTSFRNLKDDGTYPFQLPHHLCKSPVHENGIKTKKKTAINPYFGNPYPIKDNFVGRIAERKSLTEWLIKGEENIFALLAIGGMGKTSLAWAWLHRDLMNEPLLGMLSDKDEDIEICRVPIEYLPEGVFWWSFYERESFFIKFIDEALIYMCGDEAISNTRSVQDKIKKLIEVFREKRFLIILDGFERELRAYSSLIAAYHEDVNENQYDSDFRKCTDFNADTFLRWIASDNLRSRILITSRHLPYELDDVPCCKQLELIGLDPGDAIRYIQSRNIRGTQDEISRICDNYEYHPLALKILAGMIINDPQYPKDINAANYYDPVPKLRQREHHILELAYNQLKPNMKELLSRVAAFRSTIGYDAIKIINTFENDNKLRVALHELIERSLVSFDQERGLYNLHPVVREYAYKRLTDKENVHSKLKNFYLSKPNPNSVKSIEDLKDTIELYHHTVKAGLYDEAFNIYTKKLKTVLYYQIGAYQIIIKLLKGLFPDGEESPPRLEKKNEQGSALNSLALCYGRVGQLRHAKSIFKIALPFAQYEKDKATGLANLSEMQLRLGELNAAEESLNLMIDISKKLNDFLSESSARLLLSLVSAYCGNFARANKELEIAISLNSELEKKNRKRPGETNIFLYRTLVNIIASKENPKYISLSLRTARKAFQTAKSEFAEHEPKSIEVKFSLSFALLGTYLNQSPKKKEIIEEAERYLQEVTVSARNINMLEKEPDILIAWSILYIAKGDIHQAKFNAEEALFIAERCELRLKQAEIHNFLAQLAINSNEFSEAKKQALIAYECARCNGQTYNYKVALEEAESILEKVRGCNG